MNFLRLRSLPARSRAILAVALLLPFFASGAMAQQNFGAYADLSARLDRKIAELDWAGGEVSAMVVDFRHGITAYNRNPDLAIAPGSTVKLITTAAALRTLGPDFKFTTELFVRGEVSRGRLLGDLMIRGTGDPTWTSDSGSNFKGITDPIDRWVKLVKKEGISRIEGSIWVDASAFDDNAYAAGWPMDRLVDPAMPEVSALNLNDNCLEFCWKAGKKKNRIAEYELFPPLEDYLFFSNNVRVDAAGGNSRTYFRKPNLTTVAIEGRIPPGAKTHERMTVPDPDLFFGNVFKTRLKAGGVELVGQVANWSKADIKIQESRGLRRIDAISSPPLREIAPKMLAEDRTLDAEVLFKTLGARASNGPGSFENASSAISDILSGWGIPTSGLVILDGSGLSSLNRITVRNFINVLENVHVSPGRPLFDKCVPKLSLKSVMGEGGDSGSTLTPPLLPVFAVMGSLPGAQSAVGWAETGGQSRLHFAIEVGNSRVPPALLRSQVEVLVREIASTIIP